MSTTSTLSSASTKKERRNDFIKRLSGKSDTGAMDGGLGIYSRLLGLSSNKGQAFNLAKLVKTGLPLSAAETLAEHLGLEAKDFLMCYVGMSGSTLRRRFKSRQPLSMYESDCVIRYAHLLDLATKLTGGSEEYARELLFSPATALGGSTPMDGAVTETGARHVEDLMVALEYVMFS